MKKKTVVKIIVGVVLIGGAMSYFIYQAMQSSYAYYYSVDDLAADKSAAQNHSLRIAGRVKKGTSERPAEHAPFLSAHRHADHFAHKL
jgi:cytochrome c-type biogenesis protein CcmE